MDTEKIKQMGRDYFTAKPDKPRKVEDPSFWEAWRTGDGDLADAIQWWLDGYDEARYAASNEGRAIELLGRLMQASNSGDIAAIAIAEIKAANFLQEIGWKPNA